MAKRKNRGGSKKTIRTENDQSQRNIDEPGYENQEFQSKLELQRKVLTNLGELIAKKF